MSVQAVIAARGGAGAKSRCAGVLGPAERDRLAAAMLGDMLQTLLGMDAVAAVHVVTPTARLAELARRRGALALVEAGAAGLNAAFEAAIRRIAARGRDEAIVLLLGDLPALAAGDLERLLAAHGPDRIVLCPAEADGGTAAVVMAASSPFRPAFGADSFARHLSNAAAAGLETSIVHAPSLAFDVDRPIDLERVRRLIPTSRTARLLDRLGASHEAAA